MLFASREVRIGKNCARGLEYGLGPCSRPRAQLFPIWTDLGRQVTCFFFFSLENYFISNIFVDFLLQQFHTMRVRLTFRSSKPVLFRLKYLKEEIQFLLILKLSNK